MDPNELLEDLQAAIDNLYVYIHNSTRDSTKALEATKLFCENMVVATHGVAFLVSIKQSPQEKEETEAKTEVVEE